MQDVKSCVVERLEQSGRITVIGDVAVSDNISFQISHDQVGQCETGDNLTEQGRKIIAGFCPKPLNSGLIETDISPLVQRCNGSA